MVAYIVDEMTRQNTPVLTVHDSFIVLFGAEDELHRVDAGRLRRSDGQKNIQMKWNKNLTKRQLYAHGAQDRGWYLDSVMNITKPKVSKCYQGPMERHGEFYR